MSVREQVLRRVGRYEIVREVGRGGMAVVYLARQSDLDRDVALKELSAFHAGDPDVVERFLRESRLAGSLSHPNIVTVHEYFEHEGIAFIAMEYFQRGSLRGLVGALDVAQSATVLEGVLAGLAHAERRGIVHRDIKPENVMVTAEGGVKIADFGIAKALEGTERSLTGTGAAVGTPAYMAPELATGGEVGAWTDLYAVGVTAYELLSGKPPFDETEPALALMLRHAQEPVPPLGALRPDLDPALAAWVDRLLAKSPSDRPSGAAEAAEELDEILLVGLGPRWRRGGRLPENGAAPLLAAGGGAAPSATPTAPTPALRTASPRRRLWVGLGIGAAVVVASAAAWLVAGRNGGAPAATSPVPDVIPAATEQLGLAASGPRLYVSDPKGRVVGLDRATLGVRASLADPARPRSAVPARRSLLVADGETLTALDSATLAPRAARSAAGGSLLAAADGTVAMSFIDGQARGRICVVAPGLRLEPCAALQFRPTGLGAASSGRIFVADGARGAVVSFRHSSGALARAAPAIHVGVSPHGRLVVDGGMLYVPVKRGIAVVDLRARRVTTTLPLAVTPSELWISPAGRLFAALPGLDGVAVFDTAALDAAPTLVATGRRPVALAGAAAVVDVVGAGGRVTRLDARTGERRGSETIALLGAPPTRRLVLRQIDSTRSASDLSLTLRLSGGRLGATSLVVRDATIADGRASFQLWQGGIGTRVRTERVAGITLRVTSLPGRLAVVVVAAPGAYERLRTVRVDPRTVRVTVRATPRAVTSGGPTTGASTTGGQSGGSTQPSKPAQPAKPKRPTYDIG